MAIQLNERDELIFSLLQEHKVLLEKHIAWFISTESKPVLIRDRLRKLFYLDYVLCERHKDTLPWWTTPTKPLVYTLSPLAREVMGDSDIHDNIDDNDTRHLLEIANLRMLMLMAQAEGQISNFTWITGNAGKSNPQHLAARITFSRDGLLHKVGIINNPGHDQSLRTAIEAALSQEDIDLVWIVSREQTQQQTLQQVLAQNALSNSIFFVTHQELYKMGPVNSRWENACQRQAAMFSESLEQSRLSNPGQAATA